jgi:hypothetical protein
VSIKTTAAIVAIAVVSAVAVSVIGQEEPLPPVTARPLSDIPLSAPAIALAVEPVQEFQAPTLLGAAKSNDYLSFDALYTAAKTRGEDVSQYATLHELWTYSVTDPIGAFYGRDLYARLARAFPGYATYIDDFAIVDSRGNTFYPSSETRAFLIDRIVEGRSTPQVQIAEHQPIPPRPPKSVVAEAKPEPAQAKPEPVAVSVAPPVVITPESVQQQPAPAPVTVPAPAPAEQVAQLPATQPAQPAQPTRPLAGRGILLVIVGLIGIGLLAVILRTPREEQPVRIIKPEPPVASNVEPLRKPPATPATPPPSDERAAG